MNGAALHIETGRDLDSGNQEKPAYLAQGRMMRELSIDIDGKLYSGRFEVDGSVVTVHSAYGTESTQVGGLTALHVAEQLLRELVRASPH